MYCDGRKRSTRIGMLSMVWIVFLLANNSVNAFSEQLDAAEEEHLYDDRTLLDMFGEVAKEYFTKRVVSEQTYIIIGGTCVVIATQTSKHCCRYQIQTRTVGGTGDTHGVNHTVTADWSSCGATIILGDPVARERTRKLH